MTAGVLCSVSLGQVREIGYRGRTLRSAIFKQPVTGPVQVTPMGLQGDAQAGLRVHGGLSKAVYAYLRAHYAFWQTVRAQAQVSLWDQQLPWGILGENLTLDGVLENQVWVGDVLRFPDCSLAVSEPRQLQCGDGVLSPPQTCCFASGPPRGGENLGRPCVFS